MTLFTDYVQGPGATTGAVANRVELPSMTLPARQGGWTITRIWVAAVMVGTYVVSEPLVGYVIVESEDANIEPLHIPLEPQAGYINAGFQSSVHINEPTKWIVNCPIDGGGTLDFAVVTDATVSTAPEVIVVVEFSPEGSPFGGGQLHMKIGEPAVACSVNDNGETTNTALEVKANHIHLMFAYVIGTTSVPDTAPIANYEITSDDFAESGPWKGAFNPVSGSDAYGAASVNLLKQEVDRPFKSPGQKQTIAMAVIMRDAVSTAPLSNWGVVYS